MLIKALLALLAFVFWANFAFSAQDNYSVIAKEYFVMKSVKVDTNPPRGCRPASSCFKVACDLMDKFECDDQNEQANIQHACRAVWGGECITNATQILHRFEYDSNEEMTQLVLSCRGVYDLDCVNYSCQRLGKFGCDTLEELVQVNAACASAEF